MKNFLSEKDDWKRIEKNKVTTALNVLYAKKEKIYPDYRSKHNLNREKQVIILMIPNGENAKLISKEAKLWQVFHYLAVKNCQHD